MAIKITFDTIAEFEEFSTAFTDCRQSEPCGNCAECRKALKENNIDEFCYQINLSKDREDFEQTLNEMRNICEHCIWYWIDEYEIKED